MSDINEITCSAQDLAHVLDLSVQRVHQLATDRTISKPERNCFSLVASVRAYCGYIRNVSRGSHSKQEENQHRNKLLEAKAQIAAMEAKKMRGELLDAAAVHKQDFNIARALRDSLQGIPDRVASMAAAESDVAKVYDLIRTEIDHALNSAVEAMTSQEVDDARIDFTGAPVIDDVDADLTAPDNTDEEFQPDDEIQLFD